jgi:hypothetical protein
MSGATADLLRESVLPHRAFCPWGSLSREIVNSQKIRYQSIVETIADRIESLRMMSCKAQFCVVFDDLKLP